MNDLNRGLRFAQEAHASRATRRRFINAMVGTGLAGLTAGIVQPSRAADAKVTIKFGYTSTPTNPVSLGYEKFKSLVEHTSNNTITVATFCCNQLGNDMELIQAAQSGAVQMGTSSNNNLDQFTSKMMVLELPYLLKSRSAYRKFWQSHLADGIRADFEQKLGLRILMVMDAGGQRGIETVGTLARLPQDLKGLKLRVANTPIEVATFKAWGSNPVPLPYNQVFTALQQKTIDGEVLQPLWYYTDKHYEAAKKVSNIHYIMLAHVGVINLNFFNGLTKEQQALIIKAARDAEDYEWEQAAAIDAKAISALKSMPGVEFFTPIDADLQQWESTSRPVWNQFSDSIGAELIKQVEGLG